MEQTALYQISLVAAFIAGMVALFAPCCVTYLLPAYFGNIFKEKKRILFMTLIYSLGIFVVMLPVVLGAKALTIFFTQWHDQVYLFGGILMIAVAVTSFLGIKLPMPSLSFQKREGNDVVSTFLLGVVSGITSSCCAPVLMGVITLSALSPTVLQSVGVGFVYVLGMVTPLYLASLFIDKRNILEKPLLKKQITIVTIFRRSYPILVSNVVAALIFFVTGVLILVLTATGNLGMPGDEAGITKTIQEVALNVDGFIARVPAVNLIFIGVVIFFVYLLIKQARRE